MQLLAQVMKLSYFPQIKVVHTSKIFHGQLYIPVANWFLMIGTILVASIYNNVCHASLNCPPLPVLLTS
jgi:KUP system potassium uptake protein